MDFRQTHRHVCGTGLPVTLPLEHAIQRAPADVLGDDPRRPQTSAAPRSLAPMSRCAAVLWIDDAISETDSLVQGLRRSGFCVAVASSGRQGLELARTEPFSAILLDLRLPDLYGVDVLERLRSSGIGAPVIIVTGFPDLEAIRKAGALGAVHCRQKPVDPDQLVRLLRHLCHASAGPHGMGDDQAPDHDPARDFLLSLELIVDERRMRQAISKDNPSDDRAFLRALATALAGGDLPAHVFLTTARIFRHGLDASFPGAMADGARAIVAEACEHAQEPRSPNVSLAIGALEAHPRPHTLRETKLATQLAMTRSAFARLLVQETGLSFVEWRRAVTLRRATAMLLTGAEPVASIAWSAGYEHSSGFSRDFEETFGIAPSAFRRLCQTAR